MAHLLAFTANNLSILSTKGRLSTQSASCALVQEEPWLIIRKTPPTKKCFQITCSTLQEPPGSSSAPCKTKKGSLPEIMHHDTGDPPIGTCCWRFDRRKNTSSQRTPLAWKPPSYQDLHSSLFVQMISRGGQSDCMPSSPPTPPYGRALLLHTDKKGSDSCCCDSL